MGCLSLPTVTLCAVASVNVAATVRALQISLGKIDFADCLLFTDASIAPGAEIQLVSIPKIRSAAAYSEFMLRELVGHIRTEHCLVVQWDGFVLDADAWDPAFLQWDYIGAPWPQFTDGRDVGNGGFSLRSRRLLEACCDPGFQPGHPEDVAICRTNRDLLESGHGIRFADRSIAERFSYERTLPRGPTFGFHGIFNMVSEVGVEEFWSTYMTLDDRSTAGTDFRLIMRQLGAGSNSFRRRLRFAVDGLKRAFG